MFLNAEEEAVKEKIYNSLLENKNLEFDEEESIFRDKTKIVEPKALSTRSIIALVNNLIESEDLKIKHPSDLITTKNGRTILKDDYISLLEAGGITYHFNNKNPKYWLRNEEKFKPLSQIQLERKIKKIFQELYLLNSLEEVIDLEKNELKDDYLELISHYGWEYDVYKNNFIDKLNPNIRKTLVCTPEKYFRKEEVQSLALEEFKKENRELISDIKKLFGD